MAVDPKKWTHKTGEAIQAAMDLATARSHPQLTPDHVLAALRRFKPSVDEAGPTLKALGGPMPLWSTEQLQAMASVVTRVTNDASNALS